MHRRQHTNRRKRTTHQHSRWQSKRTCACFCHHLCSAGSRVAASHVGPRQCRSMPSGGTCCPEGCIRVPALPALSGSVACAGVGMGQLWPVGHSCPCAAWLAGWPLGGPRPALLEDCCQVRACMAAAAHHVVTVQVLQEALVLLRHQAGISSAHRSSKSVGRNRCCCKAGCIMAVHVQ